MAEQIKATNTGDSFRQSMDRIPSLSYIEAITKLESVTNELDKLDNSLTRTVQLTEYGTALKSHCKTLLAENRKPAMVIKLDKNGNVSGLAKLPDHT